MEPKPRGWLLGGKAPASREVRFIGRPMFFTARGNNVCTAEYWKQKVCVITYAFFQSVPP